jgi:DNA repair ATPase RecN
MREQMKAERDAEFKKVSGDKEAEVPETSQDAVSKAASEKSSLSDGVSYSKAENALDKVDENLSRMEKFTSREGDLNARVEKAGNDLGDISDSLDTVTPDNMSSVLDEVRLQLSKLTDSVKQLNVDVQKIVSESQKAEVQKDIDEMNEVDDAVKEEKTTTDDENGDPENSEPDGEPEGIPDLDL